jgi:hypothetical protein
MLQNPRYLSHDRIKLPTLIPLPLEHPRQVPPEKVALVLVLAPRHDGERNDLVGPGGDGDELGGEDVLWDDELGDGREV